MRYLLFAAAVLLLTATSVCAQKAGAFGPIGLGGGGGMYVPAASPHDPDLMFVACDMSGFYRSEDAGRTWTMLDKRAMRSSLAMMPAFHPRDASTVYAWGCGALRVSPDRGVTWEDLTADPPWGATGLTALAIDAGDPSVMIAGGPEGLYVSTDAGATWAATDVRESVVGVHIVPEGPVCFAGTGQGVVRSDDRGETWAPMNQGLPSSELRGFCGAYDTEADEGMLYCTVPSRAEGGRYVGGVFRYILGENTWQSCMGPTINTDIEKRDEYGADEVAQYHYIDTCETAPSTVWVTTRGTGYWPPQHWTVFRSDDAGETWRYVFTGDPRSEERNVSVGWLTLEASWGYGGPPSGFSVCPGNTEVAMYTNAGELFITTDGGESWYNGFCRTADGGEEARGKAWVSTGLNVTTCWEVVFDPFEPDFVYIAYTDIGFARSEDRGATWQYAAGTSPWRNTFYRVIADPDVPGRLYAACASHHDIPHWTNIDRNRGPGGMCVSEDHGKTWRAISEGLPEVACTSIELDPTSPPDARVLYAAMFGDGLYRSGDGGASWQRASQGLGEEANRHVYSVRRHPDGTLFCSITGKRDGSQFAAPSGLWRSRDGAESWEPNSTALDLRWAGDFDFHPEDSDVIYLAASSAPGYSQGGIYKTADGGATWRKLLGDDMPDEKRLPVDLLSYSHAFFVEVDEESPDRIYLGAPSHGLFFSSDAGETWAEVEGIPFAGCQRVAFDPVDREVIWVSTFGGGVWRGAAP